MSPLPKSRACLLKLEYWSFSGAWSLKFGASIVRLLPIIALFVFAGCAYTLGPVNGVVAKDKSIQIKPFVNQTVEPFLTDAVTTEVRKSLQQDGTYRLATHDDGDIIVTGTISSFH